MSESSHPANGPRVVDKPDELLPFLQQLGRDHRKFGVVTQHYEAVGTALLAAEMVGAADATLERTRVYAVERQQFGKAIGSYGSLRDAIGEVDQTGTWKPLTPDPKAYVTEMECHRRGSLLVAAVFDAFLNIYQTRVKKLIRIATGGTGRLPESELHPDLVEEMAKTAATVASDVQRICIRALDYCPPMDVTFGEFLRALITADFDMVADDIHGYRVAFVEAFQKRGISAAGIKSMAVEDLLYPLHPAGLKPEDVVVEVSDDAITISGERQHEREEERGGLYRVERTYGSFYRVVPLPDGALGDQAKANFNNGVLEITVPSPPEQVSRGRRLEITHGESKNRK